MFVCFWNDRRWSVGLGLPWSYASDVWSVGCIISELCVGELLFGTHEDMEHLALMEKILETTLPEVFFIILFILAHFWTVDFRK